MVARQNHQNMLHRSSFFLTVTSSCEAFSRIKILNSTKSCCCKSAPSKTVELSQCQCCIHAIPVIRCSKADTGEYSWNISSWKTWGLFPMRWIYLGLESLEHVLWRWLKVLTKFLPFDFVILSAHNPQSTWIFTSVTSWCIIYVYKTVLSVLVLSLRGVTLIDIWGSN